METKEVKNKILAFLGKHSLTVISTIDVGMEKPESAVIAFAETDTLELIFGTSNMSRKYANIKKNPNVSFVIGWDGAVGTVQYEGVAKELSQEESEKYADIQTAKNPAAKKFTQREDQRYFLVTPTWIRFTDNIENQIHEVVF
jgi:general stress protein 26